VQRTSGSAVVSGIDFAQTLETLDSIKYAGKTVTMSFYARAGANYSSASNVLNAYIYSGTGTDQSIAGGFTGLATAITTANTLTTTWQRFQGTGTISASATEIAFYTQYTPVGTAGANDYYEITGVQIEYGSVATSYTSMTGSIQGELDACQRYFFNLGTGTGKVIGTGNMYTTAQAHATVAFPTTMRTAPTLTLTGGTDYFGFDRASASDYFDSMSIYNASTNACLLYVSSGVSGTAGDAGYWYTNNAAASVAFNAEL
jgi:hypothetical protein